MIDRREFGVGLVGMGIAARSIANNELPQPQEPQKNTLMHLGGDYHNVVGGDITSKQNLEYNLRHSVKHLAAEVSKKPQGAWDSDELQRMKDNCERYSVVL